MSWTEDELSTLASLRLDTTPRPDPTNRWADDSAAARLGAALFFDGGLSPQGVSCATCHDVERAGADGSLSGQHVELWTVWRADGGRRHVQVPELRSGHISRALGAGALGVVASRE